MRFAVIILMVVSAWTGAACPASAQSADAQSGSVQAAAEADAAAVIAGEPVCTLVIPLQEGRVRASDLLSAVCQALQLDCSSLDRRLDQPIDAAKWFHALGLDKLDQTTRGILGAEVAGETITLTYDRRALQAVSAETRAAMMDWMAAQLGGAADGPCPHRFGISFLKPVTADSVAELAAPPQRVVLLVHGLDDPGWMWRDVIVALDAKGFVVARFDYPNDGPIAESADLLAVELAKLRQAGVRHVDVVARSMGGLVVRDVLTRPAYYNGEGTGGDRYPTIDRFIMAGTPNQGSQMARIRGLAEIGEHLGRFWSSGRSFRGWQWTDFDHDGNGEAAVDLLPGSDFLRRLNDRPLAAHTQHTLIIGRMSPLSNDDLQGWIDQARAAADSPDTPQWLRELLRGNDGAGLVNQFNSVVRGLGDGLVTMDSASLAGVDDVEIVEADHIGMLWNLSEASRVPPGISIVLDRLARPLPDAQPHDSH